MSENPSQKARFQQQDCQLTLAQGLEEFYALNTHKFSKPEPDTAWTELLTAHDACHVFFGVNTTVVDEAHGDMWTLLGTTMKFKDYSKYAKSDAARELIGEIGIASMIKGILMSLPGGVKLFLRARKMTKKWDLWRFRDHLDEKLVDLRKDYNLKILSA